jgi:hypothetical protein
MCQLSAFEHAPTTAQRPRDIYVQPDVVYVYQRRQAEKCSRPPKTAQSLAMSDTRARLAAGRLKASNRRAKVWDRTLRLVTQRQRKPHG